MKIWIAIILGIVQGITEFLPVSSSGHLILLETFLCANSSTFFNLLLHVGTLFAVVLFFWKQIVWCLKHPFSKQTLCLCLSTICTALIAFGLSKIPGTNEGIALGPCFIATGLFLLVAELARIFQKRKQKVPKPIGTGKAFAVGLVQGFAVLPGFSRSGSTISTLRAFGMETEAAVSYSFMLSIPVIVGGIVFELIKGGTATYIGILPCILAFVCSFVFGLLSLLLLKKLIKSDKWWIFIPYMLVLGIVISIWQYA